MAELSTNPSESTRWGPRSASAWTVEQTRAQFGAIARLRWQIYRNGLRRKGAKGDLAATLIVLPFALVILGGLCAGAAAGAGFAVYSGHVERVSWVLWGIFFFSQIVNLNVGQPGTTFDPTQLIRFPMKTASYTAVRLFFGILAPGNIMVVMVSLAAAAGMTVVRPHLWAWAFFTMIVFAAVNVMFTRMVFSWVDRWLSTRRAREALTALIFLVSIGAQSLNFLYNPAYHNRRVDMKTIRKVQGTVAKTEPYLRVLPPELGGAAVVAAARGDRAVFAGANLATAAWGTLFLLVFSFRMRTEYRGENLSDTANAVKSTKLVKHEVVHAHAVVNATQTSAPGEVMRAMAAKELLYLRRNTGLFYGLVMPLIMVLVFAGRWSMRSAHHGPSILMGALAYGLLGVFPMAFNSFGLDGMGAQTYFFTPVRLREVMMGKNVLCAALAFVETIAILVIMSYSGKALSQVIVMGAVLWMVSTTLVQMTVGNYMSIRSPKRIDPGRTAQKQARPSSAFLSMGIMLAAGIVGACVTFLSVLGHVEWVVPTVFACTSVAAAWIYWTNLNKLDAYAFLHRDDLFEELQKKA